MVGSDDGETPLFAGIEDSTDQGDEPTATKQPPAPSPDPLDMATQMVKGWLRGLTHREIHALFLGFAPWYLAIVTGEAALLALAVGVVGAALTERKRPTKALRAIVGEPWYCLGGATAGWLLGSSTLAWGELLATAAGVVT